MGMLHQLEKWSTTHHPRWLVFLRIILGLCLFLKGIVFLNDSIATENLLSESGFSESLPWLILTISWIHLAGGFLIIIGLLTRWATLINIPILIVAVFFVNIRAGVFTGESEFGFSLVILMLLIFFFVEGGGPVSLDNYFKRNPR